MDIWSLLIGIDCYLSNRLPDGSYYSSLSGCVRDIFLVEKFLQNKLKVPEKYILKLKSSNTGTTNPPEPQVEWPTYENMVVAFNKLADMAHPGDQVYIHYSGHGGRVPTKFPKLKTNGLDEALVPTDIGNSEARYLRDIELAYLLEKMVGKGLIVTIVLDSCHSGGATRGSGNIAVRGISSIDTTKRSNQSLVASDNELAVTWQRLTQTSRNLKLGSGWLPTPKGYVLLAACRPSEFAYEYQADGKQRNGALTYWLLDSLQQINSYMTYKQLHDRVLAKVHSQFGSQTPQLEGDDSQVVFRSSHIQLQYAVNVIQVDLPNQRVKLQTGQAQGIRKGTQFVIYPPDVREFSQLDKRLAIVEITELGATDSWAKIENKLRSVPIEQGSRAVLLDVGNLRLRRTVHLVSQHVLPSTMEGEALQRVEEVLAQSANGFVVLAESNNSADYHIAINANREYEIWDSGGQFIHNLRPALQIDDKTAIEKVVQRLVHLTKYHNIQQLDNTDSMSPLKSKLVVELAGRQADYDPTDLPCPQPFDDPGNTPYIKPGEWVFMRVKNGSSQVLNVTALALQTNWNISQIYPSNQDTDFWPFDPGEEQIWPLQVSLPPGCTEATDIVKVFATVGPVSFRWLELPPLDQPSEPKNLRRILTNPLEELFAAMVPEKLERRNLEFGASLTKEWVTVQVEVRTRSQIQ